MSGRRTIDIDRAMSDLFESGPSEAPDRVLFGALDEVANLRQRRRISIWRPRMSTSIRLAAAAVLALAAIVGGILYFGGSVNMPAPTASPTPSEAASTIPAPTASAGPTATLARAPSPTPGPSTLQLAVLALRQVDSAVSAARIPADMSLDDQGRIYQLEDDLTVRFDNGDLPGALASWPALSDKVQQVAASLSDPLRTRILNATSSLGRVLASGAMPSGALAAGTYYSAAFTPLVVITVPDGWTRSIDDVDVLALTKGSVTLAFNRMSTNATEDGLAAALGHTSAASLPTAPTSVFLNRFAGFTGGLTVTAPHSVTLWFTPGLDAHDPALGAAVRAWVLDIEGKTLTIDLDGPPADVTSLAAEVQRILGSVDSF